MIGKLSVSERFWNKVEKNEDCWLFTGSLNPLGYGRFFDGTRLVQAHRFAYEQSHGAIPEDHEIDHLCRVRACVNPSHLEPVTRWLNIRRSTNIAALRAAQTHCIHGHELIGPNLKMESNGTRHCRECKRVRERTKQPA